MTSSLPVPNAPISVRLGTRDDIPFIDALQKQYSKALGFFPRAQLEGYIDNGWVLIAEMNGQSAGYVASRDRYLKRDELGVIYQLCVSPNVQRGLIGASLIKAVFERSAYGCRLYCCWCAQDLAANRFWESLGFVPIAFRGGSEKKSRTHLFWQKRVRANDTGDRSQGGTPWWFPAKTEGGALRADRIVLPIPPGMHWSEALPVLKATPRLGATGCTQPVSSINGASGHGLGTTRGTQRMPGMKAAPLPATKPAKGAMQFGPPSMVPSTPIVVESIVEAPTVIVPLVTFQTRKPAKARVESSRAGRVDPRLITAARDLRDRYLEQVNGSPVVARVGKYDVTRGGEGATEVLTDFVEPEMKRLAA